MKHPEFAQRFNHAVALAGLESTQKSLAKLLGVSEVMIWSYRNGEKLPRMAMALKIADCFGVSINWLLQGTGEPSTRISTEPTAKYDLSSIAPSTLTIVELLESLTEQEREKARQILEVTFTKE